MMDPQIKFLTLYLYLPIYTEKSLFNSGGLGHS